MRFICLSSIYRVFERCISSVSEQSMLSALIKYLNPWHYLSCVRNALQYTLFSFSCRVLWIYSPSCWATHSARRMLNLFVGHFHAMQKKVAKAAATAAAATIIKISWRRQLRLRRRRRVERVMWAASATFYMTSVFVCAKCLYKRFMTITHTTNTLQTHTLQTHTHTLPTHTL